MKLIDVIWQIDNISDDEIIFQENIYDIDSEVLLSKAEANDNGIKEFSGKKYYYLIEIFLAKEFINDWKNSLNYSPTPAAVAGRLHKYATDDA